MAKIIEVEIEVGSKQALGSLNDLKSAATKLEEQLSSATFGSAEFNRLSSQLKSVRNNLKDVDASLEGLDKEQKGAALVDTFNGLVGAVGAVSSAFIAFGASSEEIENAEKKLLGVIGVVGGLRDVSNGLVAANKLIGPSFVALGDTISAGFKKGTTAAITFRSVLITLGIGALIAAVGYLVANFDELAAAISGVTADQKALNDATEQANTDAIIQTQSIENLSTVLNDQNTSLEVRKQAYEDLQKLVPSLVNYTYEEATALGILNKATEIQIELIKQRALADAFSKIAAEEAAKQFKIQNESLTSQAGTLSKLYAGFYNIVTLGLDKATAATIVYGSAQKNIKASVDESKKTQEGANKLFVEAQKKVLDLEVAYGKLVKGGKSLRDATKELEDAYKKAQIALKDKLDADLSQLETDKQLAISAAKTADDRIKIELDYYNRANTLAADYAINKEKLTKKEEQNAVVLTTTLNNLLNLRTANEKQSNTDLENLQKERVTATQNSNDFIRILYDDLGAQLRAATDSQIQSAIDLFDTNTRIGLEAAAKLQQLLIENTTAAQKEANAKASADKLNELTNTLNAEFELNKGNAEKQLEIQNTYNQSVIDLKNTTAATEAAIDDAAATKSKLLAEDTAKAKIAIAMNYANMQIDLASNIVGALEGLAKKGTKEEQQVAAAKVVISAAQSSQQAYSSAIAATSPNLALGLVIGTAMTALIAASARRAILAIAHPENASAAGGAPPSVGGFGIPTLVGSGSPSVLKTAGPPTTTTGQTDLGPDANQSNSPIMKTYVLAGDVTSAQAADAALNQKRQF